MTHHYTSAKDAIMPILLGACARSESFSRENMYDHLSSKFVDFF